MTETLSPGRTYTMVQNQVYALPPSIVRVQSSAAVEVSLEATTNFATLTGATTGVETGMTFVRSTGSGTLISVKKF